MKEMWDVGSTSLLQLSIVAAAEGGEQITSTQQWVLLGFGLVATVVVTVYLTILAKKALKQKGAIQVK